MDKKVKAAWLKALRSGKYKQERGALAKFDGFCCLGVLCDLAVKKKIVDVNYGSELAKYGSEENEAHLPIEVMEWAQLSGQDPLVKYGKREWLLSELNDVRRLSFKQIANVIERRL